MRRILLASAGLAALGLATPALAACPPGVTGAPGTVLPGDRITLGTGACDVASGATVAGKAALDGAGKVSAAQLTGRAAETVTVAGGTSPVTISLARALGDYVSIWLSATAAVSASGDGSTPVVGDARTAYPGQWIAWPRQPGGDPPTAPIRAVCAAACTITVTAR